MSQDAMEVLTSKKAQEVAPMLREQTSTIRPRNRNRHKLDRKRSALITAWNDIVYWASIQTVMISMVIYVLFFTGNAMYERQITVNGANQVLIMIGVNLSVICLILWVGHVTSIHEVGSLLAKALWGTFIVSLLTTSVLAYHHAMRPQEQEPLKIDSLKAVTCENTPELSSKIGDGLEGKKISALAIKTILSGYKRDERGEVRFNVKAELFDGQGKQSKSINSEGKLDKKDFRGLCFPGDGEESNQGKVTLESLFIFENLTKGRYTLNVTIEDLNSKLADKRTETIDIE